MRIPTLATAVVAAFTAAITPPAHAAYVVTFSQVGSDVVASGSGTLDTNALTFTGAGAATPGVFPSIANEVTGPAGSPGVYLGVTGPSSFGPGGKTVANVASGDTVAISGPNHAIGVPAGYVSGAALSDTATYVGQTFASLGLTPGAYVYTFGSGASADTFTVNVSAVPEPGSIALLSASLVGLVGLSRRRMKA